MLGKVTAPKALSTHSLSAALGSSWKRQLLYCFRMERCGVQFGCKLLIQGCDRCSTA